MKAWELRAFAVESLALVDRPKPVPKADEVLVDIAAVSLNYRDLVIAAGTYAPTQRLPMIPASDAVGTVSAVGAEVTQWKPGDRVIGCYMQTWERGQSHPSDRQNTLGSPLDGVLCTQRVFPQGAIVAAPAGLSDAECATLPIAGLTAWCALFEAGGARPGDTILVQGSGGVSTFAIQIGAAEGLRVIAVSRSARKLEVAGKLGASVLVDSTATPDWGAAVLEQTRQVGADVILDVGGQSTLRQSLRSAAQNGRIVSIGFLGGTSSEIDVRQVIAKNLTLRGVTVGSRTSFGEFLRFLDQSRIRPVVDNVFDFEEAPQAFARLASGDHHGKIVVKVGSACLS
jgi:NADPH:quinone reductase-like Zn-dependent oxidoreductase